MEEVFRYLQTHVQLSLCNQDETIQNTLKSKKLLELEKRISSCSSGTSDGGIFHRMFFLHLIVDLSLIFGPLEKSKRYGIPSFI